MTLPTPSPEEVARLKGRLLWFALGLPCLLVTLFSLSPWLVDRAKDLIAVFAIDTVWTGRYYTNPDLEGRPAEVREDPVITFDWGEGERFELNLTRQLIVEPGGDDNIWQLSLTYRFEAADDYEPLGEGNEWCDHPERLAELEAYLEESEPYAELGEGVPAKVTLVFDVVG